MCFSGLKKNLPSPLFENMVPKAEIKVVKIEISILKTQRLTSFQNFSICRPEAASDRVLKTWRLFVLFNLKERGYTLLLF